MKDKRASREVPRGWRPTWRFVFSILTLALVGLFSYTFFRGGDADDSDVVAGELTYRVTRGDLRISLIEPGDVRAARSVPIFCRLEGQHTIVSLVAEGASVKKGDVLVEFDDSELTQELNQQQIAVDRATAEYLQAEEMLEIQKSLCESDIQKAELDRQLSELDLMRYESEEGGEYVLSLMKADANVMISEQELKRAQNTYEWTKKLADKGYISGTELTADKLSWEKAEIQLSQAIGARKLLKEYTHRKDLAKYKSAHVEAQSSLKRAERKSKATLAQYEAAKRGKESTVVLSKTRLAKISDQLEKAIIYAPQDGLVVYANAEPWRRDRRILQGAEVHEKQLLMYLPDLTVMAVDVEVPESWVDQVKEGLPALVSVDSLPGLSLKGNVTKVGMLPDSVNRWVKSDLKSYATEITLEDSPDVRLLRPGISAKVEILIAVLKEIVFVPVQSVSRIDQAQVCYVLSGSEFLPRNVRCGKFNESFMEILAGLEEGEVIQLTAPAPKGIRSRGSEKEMETLAREIHAVNSRSVGPELGGGSGGSTGSSGGAGESSGKQGGPEGVSVKPLVHKDGSVAAGGGR